MAKDRISVKDLKTYVPLFQLGDRARQRLDSGKDLSVSEKIVLESEAGLKDLALYKIATLSGPLITQEIHKIISSSHLKNQESELFNILYYAGISGLEKGLRKFDVDKINVSSTNYIFQWITVYAKKELLNIESPMGVAPSRFQKFKKISAVRKKMTDDNDGVEPTDEEVYEYFQSGKADRRNFQGRLKNSGKPSKENKKITLDLIKEQKEVEKNLNFATVLDVTEDFRAESRMSHNDSPTFDETIFGIFLNSDKRFLPKARVVLKSDLQYSLSTEESIVMLSISDEEYKYISSQWRDILRAKNGPFYKFLKNLEERDFQELNIDKTIANIESYGKVVKESRFSSLYCQEDCKEKEAV